MMFVTPASGNAARMPSTWESMTVSSISTNNLWAPRMPALSFDRPFGAPKVNSHHSTRKCSASTFRTIADAAVGCAPPRKKSSHFENEAGMACVLVPARQVSSEQCGLMKSVRRAAESIFPVP